MSTNIKQFVSAVKTEIEIKGFNEFGLFKKRITKIALRRLVDATPVDTGRLKGNWKVGVNNIPRGFDPNKFDKGGEGVKAEGGVIIDSSSGLFDDLVIVNNVNYIKFIHDGTDRITANPFIEGVAAELGLEIIRL